MSSNEYYPNYGYVGAPANYNGTGANGGDSGMFPSLRVFEYQIVPPQFAHSIMGYISLTSIAHVGARELNTLVKELCIHAGRRDTTEK